MNLAHTIETGTLMLAAYLSGCVLGYGLRWALHTIKTPRIELAETPPAMAVSSQSVSSPRISAAARLAATVEPASATAETIVPQPQVPLEIETPAATKQPDHRPACLAAPRNGQSDNLKKIKGIGPKIESVLNELGVFHLDQIAAWTDANAEWVEGRLAFKGRVRREGWIAQAARLIESERDLGSAA